MADEEIIKTDLLIVGAGPAGASLACFLAAHGRFMAPERPTNGPRSAQYRTPTLARFTNGLFVMQAGRASSLPRRLGRQKLPERISPAWLGSVSN